MSTFGNMQRRIATEMRRDDVLDQISDAILSAIRCYEGERLWFNECETTANTVADQQSYAVPSNFLEADTLTVTDASGVRYILRRRDWSWFRERSQITAGTSGNSTPTDWCYYADQMHLWPIPDAARVLTLSYLERKTELSADTDTNEWMTRAEELIRNKAKSELWMNVGESQRSEAHYQRALVELDRLRARAIDHLSTGHIRPERGLLGA